MKIISIVDRDAGTTELFVQPGYEYQSIFTKDEVARGVHEAAVGVIR